MSFKRLFLIFAIVTSTSFADVYIDYMDGFINDFSKSFSDYNALVVDTSASMIAMSNIDFNPDHKGFSLGVGLATLHSEYGIGNAYAVGTQYGFEFGSINIKGSMKKSNEYVLGTGIVIGF